MKPSAPSGILFLVATPIGNEDDLTFRALKTLKSVDVVVYEERREGERLLARLGITPAIVEQLNEHNEERGAGLIVQYLREGKNVALVSDAGTPVLADPGHLLVEKAIAHAITVVPLPGASSILPALTASGFATHHFLYYGFLSPKTEHRLEELRLVRNEERTMIFMDTPYRLVQLLRDMTEVFGPDRRVCVAFNITMKDEKFYRDAVGTLLKHFAGLDVKGEFVVVAEGAGR